MHHRSIGQYLPRFLSAPLFGDRERFGVTIQPEDPSWKEWEARCVEIYRETQKRSIGAVVNDAGYDVISRVDLSGKHVLEVGPGDINHLRHWRDRPECYYIADIRPAMLEGAAKKLQEADVPVVSRLVTRGNARGLPFADEQFDVIVSFYSLEHLYPLDAHLEEMLRVLRPGGVLVGAIPSEGGLAWGMGRYLTSRRWMQKHTTIDPDKIICWEHPNFACDILCTLDARMQRKHLRFWPMGVPSIDLNLIIKFVYTKG